MQGAFDKAQGCDREKVLKPKEKAKAWGDFLKAFKADNPHSQEDKMLRKQAQERYEYWDEYEEPSDDVDDDGHQPGEERTFDGIEFVWIPAGEFRMGSAKSEKDRHNDEGPVHTVRISKAHGSDQQGFLAGQVRGDAG